MAIVDTAPAAEADEFVRLPESMSYGDPQVRPLLDPEGLKQWVSGRTSGFGPLARADDETGFYDATGTVTAQGYDP
jgi:phosphonate transport system substrate-binding protein